MSKHCTQPLRNYFNPVRADASTSSAVNAEFILSKVEGLITSRDYFNPVRAELVEAYELI